jgi:hypothetical protein
MSLLEKAIRGSGSSSSEAGASLFSRAVAAQAAVLPGEPSEADPAQRADFSLSDPDALMRRLASLPPYGDSLLAAWCAVSESIPLSALSLFLPRGEFLVPAAQNGFPSGTEDGIPMSFASSSHMGAEALGKEAKALLAPILGVPLSLSLRAAAMVPESDFVGLWVYHDPSLDSSSEATLAMIGSLLARAGDSLPPSPIAIPSSDPARVLIDASRKYPYASAFSFDLTDYYARDETRLRGLKADAVRSAFLSACARILSLGGATAAYGELSVACALGSASPIDPDLALFQLRKTLRRILPFLASGALPEGRAAGFVPSSELAHRELSAFLSR